MLERSKQMVVSAALNAAGTVPFNFYFPKAARIKRYWAVPNVDQAAHASVVDTVTFTNKGTDGSGSTVLCVLTNDSDLADSTTRKSSAWSANVVKELNTEDRPGAFSNTTDVADEIAAGSVVQAALLGAGTTPTANFFTIGIEYVESD